MRILACLLTSLTLAVSAIALRAQPRHVSATADELRAEHAYDVAVRGGPLALHAFLENFPKGADLHVHTSGAVYAETFIRDAGEDGLCVDPTALSFANPPCVGKLVPAASLSGDMTAASQVLYDKLIDAFSMRSFVPSEAWSGHDQFFATFDRFSGLSGRHLGEWVDEIARRAARQNEQYLELMNTPPYAHAKQIAEQIGWSAEMSRPDVGAADFARLRQQLLERGLRDEVSADREEVHRAEAERERMERCGTDQAAPACKVEIRYIYQVLRDFPPEEVFAQTLLGFESVAADISAGGGGFVGINFVMHEDGYISMRDYTLQMKMLDYLHSVYPKVHISLHAGELAPGMVRPAGLRFHVRQAVELGHAERIGHGVDVMFEEDPWELLKEMAARHVMVEINLTSNAVILGIKSDEHPFSIYRQEHVPVALSTDDEGVSRIDLTHEYAMAAREYHLSYADLEELARTGMEHDFLPGASLWARPDNFHQPVAACRGQILGGERSTSECKAFLEMSEKAAAQWELERRFRAFEARQ
ncbi:MAG TPA: adenosine deaminase [Terracidiphilus sp.]